MAVGCPNSGAPLNPHSLVHLDTLKYADERFPEIGGCAAS